MAWGQITRVDFEAGETARRQWSTVEEVKAQVKGVYEVTKKPGDPTVVGYVVHGAGSDGGYDYSEAFYIAVSMTGRRVVESNEDW